MSIILPNNKNALLRWLNAIFQGRNNVLTYIYFDSRLRICFNWGIFSRTVSEKVFHEATMVNAVPFNRMKGLVGFRHNKIAL